MIPGKIKTKTLDRLQVIKQILETRIMPDYQDEFDMLEEPLFPTKDSMASQLMTAALNSIEGAMFLLQPDKSTGGAA